VTYTQNLYNIFDLWISTAKAVAERPTRFAVAQHTTHAETETAQCRMLQIQTLQTSQNIRQGA